MTIDEVYKREKLPRLGARSCEVVNYEEYAMRWSRKSEKGNSEEFGSSRGAPFDEVFSVEARGCWYIAELRAYEEVLDRALRFEVFDKEDPDEYEEILEEDLDNLYMAIDDLFRAGGRERKQHPFYCEHCNCVHAICTERQWCQLCVDAGVGESGVRGQGGSGRCERDFFWCSGCRKVTFADGHDIGALDDGLHAWPASKVPAAVGCRASAWQ